MSVLKKCKVDRSNTDNGAGHSCEALHKTHWLPLGEPIFTRATRSKRSICYGNVAGWLAGYPSHAGVVSKRQEEKIPTIWNGAMFGDLD